MLLLNPCFGYRHYPTKGFFMSIGFEMNEMISFNEVQTMSSLEIAKLTDKEHAHVMRDIRKTLEEAEIGEAKFGASYLSTQNKELPCYNLPRRECDLVVSGYSVKYRLAIIDRWQELEAKQKPMTTLQLLEHAVSEIKAKDAEIAKLNTLLDNELGFCSIIRAATFLGIHETAFNWRVLKSETLRLGIEIKKVPSPPLWLSKPIPTVRIPCLLP
jgi:phage regulator Rha-like protein